MRYSCCFHVYRKEYLRKSSQNSVHYLSCHAVRCTADFNFCSSHMLKGLGLGTCGTWPWRSRPWPWGLRSWPWRSRPWPWGLRSWPWRSRPWLWWSRPCLEGWDLGLCLHLQMLALTASLVQLLTTQLLCNDSHTHVHLSPISIIWYRSKDTCSLHGNYGSSSK